MADEARTILDQLMGGDRNARLPLGTSVPRRKVRRGGDSSATPLLLPTQRSKSCYDPDVDPYYCAWGVNVYELFVNTKSDLGTNPKIPDDGARREYLSLPKYEQERLGFEAMLFAKLQELVRQGDRTVSRNKEKLEQEIQRNASKNMGRIDYVKDIDEGAVNQLAQCQLRLNEIETELNQIFETMEEHILSQTELEHKLKEKKDLLEEMEANLNADTDKTITDQSHDAKLEQEDNNAVVKTEPDSQSDAIPMKSESELDTDLTAKPETLKSEEVKKSDIELLKLEVEELSKELEDQILKKQRSQFDLARKIQQYAPIQESSEQQRKQLYFVKSDITMDKTVCEVSGNFMSARDADERIAAHYAGKQYVGWKLVRDKFAEMQQKYGRFGPPRAPPPQSLPPAQQQSMRRTDDSRMHPPPPSALHDERFMGGPPPIPAGGGSHNRMMPRGGGGFREYDRGRDRGGSYGRGGGHERDRRSGGGRWGR